jgi:hypothetical protein
MVEEVGIEVEGAVLEVLGSLIEVVEEMEGEDVEDGKEVEEGEREDEKVDITVPVSKEVVMVTSEEVCSTDVERVVTTFNVTVFIASGEEEFDPTVWGVVGVEDMVVSGCDVFWGNPTGKKANRKERTRAALASIASSRNNRKRNNELD